MLSCSCIVYPGSSGLGTLPFVAAGCSFAIVVQTHESSSGGGGGGAGGGGSGSHARGALPAPLEDWSALSPADPELRPIGARRVGAAAPVVRALKSFVTEPLQLHIMVEA